MVQSQSSTTPKPIPSLSWWSGKGCKMQVEKLDLKHGKLRIGNSPVASVTIVRPRPGHEFWRVYWHVEYFSGHANAHAEGHFLAEPADLRAAFGLTDYSYPGSDSFILDHYEGDVALQGSFIRHGDRLNIPGPGLPWQGSPTVSVLINDDIRTVVRQLLGYLEYA